MARASSDIAKPIEVPSLNGVCYERIKEMILNGDIAWGEKIDVGLLARTFGISKFPVIKAIERLSLENLVIVSPNRGTYVVVPDRRTVSEVAQIRQMIEEYALSYAFCNFYQDLISKLSEVQDSNSFDIFNPENIDSRKFLGYDRAFHVSIVSCTHNSQLLGFYESIRTQVELFRVQTFIPENIAEALRMHEAIFASLKEGNLTSAMADLRKHISEVYDESVDTISRRDAST